MIEERESEIDPSNSAILEEEGYYNDPEIMKAHVGQPYDPLKDDFWIRTGWQIRDGHFTLLFRDKEFNACQTWLEEHGYKSCDDDDDDNDWRYRYAKIEASA